MTSFPRPASLVLLLLAWLLPRGLAAQDASSYKPRVPASIVLVEEIEDGGPGALILRRASRFPHDLILLRERVAGAELVSAAIFTLLVARDLLGDVPETDVQIPVLRSAGPRAWKKRVVPQLGRLLARLRAAEPAPVSGIGTGKRVVVWLPAGFDTRLSVARGGARGGRRR